LPTLKPPIVDEAVRTNPYLPFLAPFAFRSSPSPTVAAEDSTAKLFSPVTAKILLDEEMKKGGGGGKGGGGEIVHSQEELGWGFDWDDEDEEEDVKEFVVTEADYDQLLREIEEEMRRDEEVLLDEYESRLRDEGEYFEEVRRAMSDERSESRKGLRSGAQGKRAREGLLVIVVGGLLLSLSSNLRSSLCSIAQPSLQLSHFATNNISSPLVSMVAAPRGYRGGKQ